MLGLLLAAAAAVALCVAVDRWSARAGRAEAHDPWLLALQRFRRNRRAMAALYVLLVLGIVTVLAPLAAPYDPDAQLDIVAKKGLAPSLAHPFGTDQVSRDLLSRVLDGGRLSLGIALLSVAVAVTIGTAYGAIAGYAGGRADAVMMRLLDALLSMPRILLLIVVFSLWQGAGLGTLVLLLGFTGWFGVSRIVRAQVLQLKTREFVVSANALGAGGARVLLRHILPNVVSPVLVAATLAVGNVIILESGLSFLGIGVHSPQASWGNIIQDGREVFRTLWWITAFPGLAIVITVMAVNTVGDGLRDALDPREHA